MDDTLHIFEPERTKVGGGVQLPMMVDHFCSAVSCDVVTPLDQHEIGYSASFSVFQPVQTFFVWHMTGWRMFPEI